jgi:hypothetical protein
MKKLKCCKTPDHGLSKIYKALVNVVVFDKPEQSFLPLFVGYQSHFQTFVQLLFIAEKSQTLCRWQQVRKQCHGTQLKDAQQSDMKQNNFKHYNSKQHMD